MSEKKVEIPPGYPIGQWAKAVRAAGDRDPAVRERAAGRIRRWEDVIRAVVGRTVAVGDRAPVAGLPAWVTLEVVTGGFATGRAMAEVPPDAEEKALAERAGLPAERGALFGHHLTDEGLRRLSTLLHSGGYRLEAPESAALPIVAWLLDHGHADAAANLVEEIIPLAPRLRFTPKPCAQTPIDPSLVYRQTAGQVRAAVQQRKPNQRVETMREALTVWNPFADQVLTWWLGTTGAGPTGNGGHADQPAGRPGDLVTDAMLVRARELAERYQTLSAEHTLCTKHRNPKENLAILLSGITALLAGDELDARRRGLIRHAVESMVRRRGTPGDDKHRALRGRQADNAAVPTHTEISGVVADRLADLPPDVGVADVEAVAVPVAPWESSAHPAVPAGTPIPAPLVRIVRRATADRVEDLVDRGLIGSAETLAGLLPQLTARTFAAAFPDPDLSPLMAALYRTFRARRSLLLVNLRHQVRIDELPWVAALSGVRTGSARTEARHTLRELGALALSGFPGTQPSNPLVTELAALSASAELGLPWVEELAADIFMGVFSAKYQAAAKIAGNLLAGSVYERYYGIDYATVLALPDPEPESGRRPGGPPRLLGEFNQLCLARAARAGQLSDSVAANGMVIEQAQILTTHNLATLAGPCGVRPAGGWQPLADGAFARMTGLGRQLIRAARPKPVIKDLAYAWRQAVFFLAMPGADAEAFSAAARDRLREADPAVGRMLTPVLDGLDAISRGESFDADGRAGDGWQLLGWDTGGHWLQSRRLA